MSEELSQVEIIQEGEIRSKGQREVHYRTPKFGNRVLANLVDILLFVVIFVASFSAIRLGVNNSKEFKSKNNQILETRLNSGLYTNEGETKDLQDIVTYINKNEDFTNGGKKKRAIKAIDTFLSYMSETDLNGNYLHNSEEDYLKVVADYTNFRTSSEMTYSGVNMFVHDSGEIIENPELVGDSVNLSRIHAIYYEKCYAPFIDEHLQGYLITCINGYYDLTRYVSLVLFFGELLPAYCFAGVVVYLVPMLIFKRGRKTIGKLTYHIGLVDSNITSPKLGRTLARFAIFYFMELLLSLVSFGLPYIISFSMMVFSKHGQGFPDYILGLREVDTSNNKIYLTLDEVDLDKISTAKKAPNFKLRNFD